jgi:hypothetical protein
MFIRIRYFFLFCSQDQRVIPMRITQEMIQTMKGVIGSAPFCELILVKTTIPMMTSAMVSPMGILIDNFISFILVSFRSTHAMTFQENIPDPDSLGLFRDDPGTNHLGIIGQVQQISNNGLLLNILASRIRAGTQLDVYSSVFTEQTERAILG